MDSKAQGAMEYLMTYGWAILIVMVVGIAMWQLGMFNMQPASITSSGFDVLRPILATCQFRPDAYLPGGRYRGFTCQFVNVGKAQAQINHLFVLVDDQTCDWGIIMQDPVYIWPWGSRRMRVPATGTTTYTNTPSYYPITLSNYVVEPDEQFSVFALGDTNFDSSPGDHCLEPEAGRGYKVYVDMTYDVNIGGVASTKHSIGTIHVIGSETT
jgi:hypothetical protein